VFTYIDRANEILVSHQYVCHCDSKDDGQDPSSYESFHSLLWGQLDELCAAERDSADIGEDIVANDQGDWKEEPDHSFKNVVHNKMGLNNNQVECHVSPCKLRELEAVVTGLQRSHEKHESYLQLAPEYAF
jgi:hypothetical protein